MKKLLSILILCTITLMVSAQTNTNTYKPCDECFGYRSTQSQTSPAQIQYNQVCANGLYAERPIRERRDNRILRIAVGIVAFVVIIAILPQHDTPYIQ